MELIEWIDCFLYAVAIVGVLVIILVTLWTIAWYIVVSIKDWFEIHDKW